MRRKNEGGRVGSDDQIFALIAEKDGKLTQSEISRIIGMERLAGSRLASRTVMNLIKEGLVERTKLLVDGHSTFTLHLTAKGQSRIVSRDDASFLVDMPCLGCPYADKCNDDNKTVNPKTCPWLEGWVLDEYRKGSR